MDGLRYDYEFSATEESLAQFRENVKNIPEKSQKTVRRCDRINNRWAKEIGILKAIGATKKKT